MLSRQQEKKDQAEAIIARRIAANKLREVMPLIDVAVRKLAYNKSDAVIFELKRIAAELKENIETLEDPEYIS